MRDNAGAIGFLRAMSNATDTTDRHWPDLAGRLVEVDGVRAHALPIRVYFEDTDFSGLVYHASYVRWCERGALRLPAAARRRSPPADRRHGRR
ncbi:MAG: hypothetical protein WDN31_17730 [Hyphomicrobium sp.]